MEHRRELVLTREQRQRLAAVISDDGHFIDDPVDVVNIKPDFHGLGFNKKHKKNDEL